jgi:hypothetical protein
VVSHGTAPAADVTLEAASRIADAVRAELVGLFVKDTALFELADLPFSKEIPQSPGDATNLSRRMLENTLKRHEASFERALSVHATRMKLSCTCSTATGDMMGEILAQSDSGDIVVLSNPALGITTLDNIKMARHAAARAAGVVIAGRSRSRRDGPVVAIDEGGSAGLSIISVTAQLAARANASAIVFVAAPDEQSANAAIERDREVMGSVPVDFITVADPQFRDLSARLSACHPRIVVAGLKGALFGDDRHACALIRAARAPVLLLKN